MRRDKVVPAAHILFIQTGELLLLRRGQNVKYGAGLLSVPAGHVERGESPVASAIREAGEEVGLSVRAEDCRLVHVLHRIIPNRPNDRINYFFEAMSWAGVPENKEEAKGKCSELFWTKDWPHDGMVDFVAQALREYRKGNLYSEMCQND